MTARVHSLHSLVGLSGFRCIVADPPWPQQGSYAVTRGFAVRIPEKRKCPIPYPTMTMAEIEAMPVAGVADKDAHLYLWTTQQFLRDSFRICEAWGFRVAATLVWCKAPHGIQIGGPFGSSVEFVHFARRGNLPTIGKVNRRWFTWPRLRGAPVKMGETRTKGHSAKPEAFQDMVETVSPGPRLELFARRARPGWTVWGNEVEANKWYRLEGHKPVPCDASGTAVDDTSTWRVALTETAKARVSTVFLGLDHHWIPGDPPHLFETMVFGGALDSEQDRYATWDEAEKGHAAMVVRVIETEKGDAP